MPPAFTIAPTRRMTLAQELQDVVQHQQQLLAASGQTAEDRVAAALANISRQGLLVTSEAATDAGAAGVRGASRSASPHPVHYFEPSAAAAAAAASTDLVRTRGLGAVDGQGVPALPAACGLPAQETVADVCVLLAFKCHAVC